MSVSVHFMAWLLCQAGKVADLGTDAPDVLGEVGAGPVCWWVCLPPFEDVLSVADCCFVHRVSPWGLFSSWVGSDYNPLWRREQQRILAAIIGCLTAMMRSIMVFLFSLVRLWHISGRCRLNIEGQAKIRYENKHLP